MLFSEKKIYGLTEKTIFIRERMLCMSTNENSLELLREQLDATNLQLLELLSQRAELAGQLGKLKEAQGVPDFDPVREQQMLDKLIAANRGPFDDATIRQLFKNIFKASLNYQKEEHKKASDRQPQKSAG